MLEHSIPPPCIADADGNMPLPQPTAAITNTANRPKPRIEGWKRIFLTADHIKGNYSGS